MFMFGNKKNKKNKLILADCTRGAFFEISNFPAAISQNGEIDSNSPDAAIIEKTKKGDYLIYPDEDFAQKIELNSAPLGEKEPLQEQNTLKIGDTLLLLFAGEHALESAKKIDFSKWIIFNTESGTIEDVAEFGKIRQAVEKRALTGSGLAVCPKGATCGFFYKSVFGSAQPQAMSPLDTTSGEIRCPLCWLKFDLGDALSIASHESLRGDPILGSEEMLRFLPTAFDGEGNAIDPAGMPSHDIACPHCRKKLPTGYVDLKRHIFSIVGAPSAGKSYYLSVLIKELQNSVFRHYGASLKDLDPSGNMLLTQMKNRLFSADTPESAILAKTALEGAMYEKYPRFGKMVSLPKPMSYIFSKDLGAKTESAALIFYDNAGEHFEPGIDLEDSPGAMHVACSDAIFFLFDPAANRNFKNLLHDNPDPQLKIAGRLDQQDTILAEMEVRIKRILALSTSEKIQTPLAVMLGKFDIWKDLLGEKLADYFENGELSEEAVERNSEILRNFMLKTEPSIVAGAEAVSSNVKYFAISPLGHSPIKISEGNSAGKIAPVPSLLNPINVDIPMLWVLRQLEPSIMQKRA